jgi:hypothetical protein
MTEQCSSSQQPPLPPPSTTATPPGTTTSMPCLPAAPLTTGRNLRVGAAARPPPAAMAGPETVLTGHG